MTTDHTDGTDRTGQRGTGPIRAIRAIRGHVLPWLAAVLLTMRAAVCSADFDMTGTWNAATGPFATGVLDIVQTGTSLSMSIPGSPFAIEGSGTIDPMTGVFTFQLGPTNPPDCGGVFSGQLGADGNTFIAPGNVFSTPPDPAGAVRGIDRILLKSSAQNKAKILIKGQGSDLPLVLPPLTDPITIQLINGSSGVCWGANFNVAQMRRNDAEQLKAKAP